MPFYLHAGVCTRPDTRKFAALTALLIGRRGFLNVVVQLTEGGRRIHSIRRLVQDVPSPLKIFKFEMGFLFPLQLPDMDKFPEHDPRCGRETEGQWYSQQQDIALADAPELSQRFFAEVFNEFPALATSVVFWRWSVGPDHLCVVFNFSSGGFGVQIDSPLEYIYVWGAGEHGEYGDWMGVRLASALDHVRTFTG